MAGWEEVLLKGGSAADADIQGAAQGNLLVADAALEYVNFTAGAAGKVLTSAGVAATPTWETPSPLSNASEEGSILVSASTPFAYTEHLHGTDGDVLTTKGNGAQPTWETPAPASGVAQGNLLVAGAGAGYTYANFTAGTAGKVLTAGGVDAALTWETPTTYAPATGAAHGNLLMAGATPFTYANFTAGAANKVLTAHGVSAALTWETPTVGDFLADGTVAMTGNIDFANNCAKDMKLYTTVPAVPADGHIYFDTTTDKIKVYVA